MRLNPRGGIRELEVARFDHVPHAVQPALHRRQLRLYACQFLPLLVGHPVQLGIHEPHEGLDVVRRQNAVSYLIYNQPLEAPGVEPGGVARRAAPVEQRLADVVGELAALGRLAGEGPPTPAALDQPTEQVGTGGPAGVGVGRCFGGQQSGHPSELVLGDEGRKGVRHAHGRRLILGAHAPDQGTGVDLVGEHAVDRRLQPALAVGTGDPLGIEGLGDVEQALPAISQGKQAAHHAGGGLGHGQLGALLGAVGHQHAGVAVGQPAGHPEAAGSRLAHAPRDLLGQVLGVELVHALDDGFHQLARGRVVGVLRDGDDPDALTPQHGLEGHGMLALAGKARELPDQDDLEGGLRAATGVQHFAELRPVGDAPALGLVHVFAGDDVAMLRGVVPQRPQLGGDREVHVLAIAGHAGV